MSNPQYAGFWIRFLACLIDSILLSMLLAPLLPLIIGVAADDSLSPLNIFVSLIISLVATVLFWRYRSATPGKIVLGLHIVDAKTGAKPSNRQLFVRYFAYYAAAIPLLVGFVAIAFDARKQGWHDKIAGTLVVKNSQKMKSND